MRTEFTLTENTWRAVILGVSCAVLFVTVYCLSQGITIIFMHLYYLPIVLLAYHYRRKGVYLSVLLSLLYLALVAVLVPGDNGVLVGAVLRAFVFTGIAAIVVFLVERRDAEEALRQSEERFRQIFTNSPIGMALTTPDFRFFSVNPAWVSMTGYAKDELLTMSFQDITHPDNLAGDLEEIRKLAAGTIPVYSTEKRYIRKDKSILWGYLMVTVIRDPPGRVRYFSAQIEDITPRKQAESALTESSSYNRSLIEASLDPLVTISPEGKIQDVNAATEKATGLPRDNLIGTDFTGYFADPQKAREGYLQVFSEGKVLDYPLEMRHVDGHTIPVLYNATVCHDSEGNIRGVFAAARDITRQKQAEDALRESGRRYRELVENLNDVIFTVDTGGLITYVSPVGERQFGYSPRDLTGRPFTDVVYSEDVPALLRRFDEIGRGIIEPFEWRLVHRDGSHSWVRTSTRPVLDAGGKSGFLGVISDISREKQAEERLRDSENKFATIFRNSPVALTLVSATDGKIVDINEAFANNSGYARKDAIGKTADNLGLFPDADERRRMITSLRNHQRIHGMELKCRTKSGEIRTCLFSAGFIVMDKKPYVLSTIEDITERKRAEVALRESEEKYRLIADNTADNIWIFDMYLRLMYISPSVEKMKGFTVEESMAMPLDQVMTPASLSALLERFREEMEREAAGTFDPSRTVSFETEEYCKDGSTIIVENSATLLRDADGRPHSILGISRDVTARKRADDALRESEAEYRLLAETSPEMIYLIDNEGYVQYVNQTAARLFHAAPGELAGKHLSEIFPPETAKNHLYALRKVAADRTVLRREITEEFPAGRLSIEVRLAPVINSQDQVIGVLGLSNDITQRRQAEEQREELIRELGAKNAELDRFTYTVSHDLKSPLLAIRAFLALLEGDIKSGDTERVSNDIQRMSESAEKLETLITTLLALSRSGRSVDVPVKIPFGDLTREAATLLGASLKEHGVTLVIPGSMPVVTGDRQRLLQVMTNLLDNAVRFMGNQKEPRVEISVRTDAGTQVFCVRDNGMGISPENLLKVFGLYERLNPEIPGTGIGLSTVKRIIEAHGGRIWMESEGEGKGTTVCFTLPVAPEKG